jgi:hypothetical protein
VWESVVVNLGYRPNLTKGKNFYQLPFTPPSLVARIGTSFPSYFSIEQAATASLFLISAPNSSPNLLYSIDQTSSQELQNSNPSAYSILSPIRSGDTTLSEIFNLLPSYGGEWQQIYHL